MRFHWLAMVAVLGFAGWAAAGYVQKEISYYEPDASGTGNTAYLEQRCKLDLYYPEEAENAPTVIWFHGGGLVGGEKFIPEMLKNSGLIVAAPNYRLSGPRATTKESLADAAAATAWVFGHIAEYGGDPDAVYISGGSGGGYLAAMLGMNPDYLAAYGLDHRKFAGVMPISGQMTTHMQVLNEQRGTTGLAQPKQQAIDEYAPLYYVSADLAPITLYVGDPDIEWPARVEENAMLAAMLKRVAGHKDVEFVSLKGFDHGDVYDAAFLLMKKRINADRLKKLRTQIKPAETRVTAKRVSLPLTGRFGEAFAPESRVSFKTSGGNLLITLHCEEPDSGAVQLAGDVFSGDCVEIFLAPDPAHPEVAGQWGINRDGRTEFVAHGNIAGEFAAAAEIVIVREDGRWVATLALPLTAFADPSQIRGNVFRHCKTPERDAYANWSPTLVPSNFVPEAFGIISVE